MSAKAFFLSGSSTNTNCQPCEFDPVGACRASSRHSNRTSFGTGFSRSSRLRTERVVVRSSSTERLRVIAGDYIRIMSADLTPEVIDRLSADHYGWLTTAAKVAHVQRRPR